ncbi:type VI secretion system-associated protein TagF [Rugamonas sp. CCM 8940]|uniref:type VI secretion system-associated protein TagF n=1 Tax=Rugamonas sp. CCM 8940 TaxID=2765359 RepID=UPI0018F6F767|nr:type VI secretion system-associated protein TagF [Rugamonas sp. CCM 8940]
MKRAPQRSRVGYFGKIPARSDFIRAADNAALVDLLDQWLAGVMSALTADPRWKQHYDALAPLHFAFVGTRSKRAIAGRLIASGDQSQRRYPFLAMSTLDIAAPPAFLARSPLVLAPLWRELARQCGAVLATAEPGERLHALAAVTLELDPDAATHDDDFLRFLDSHSLAGLEMMLASKTVRQTVLALGLLLQPVRGSGAARLERSLALPLPQEEEHRFLVAAFWLDLIAPFLQQADFELALFFTELYGRPTLVVGFDGAAPATLLAIIDARCASEQLIDCADTGWVEMMLGDQAGVQKLSTYLEQGQLSLRSVHALFHETFV